MMKAIVFCLFLTVVAAYKTGAPEGICPYIEMVPQHGKDPQDHTSNPPPYGVFASKLRYTPGQKIFVTIRELKGVPFKGFAIAAEEGGERIGSWEEVKGKIQQLKDCPVATHVNELPKTSLKLVWKAPSKSGEVDFRATVVQTGYVFWTNVFAKEAATRPLGRR